MTISCVERKEIGSNELLLFRLTNASGHYAEILNLGATIVSIVVPDKKEWKQNVILRYPDISAYADDTFYLGATIGRVANRIRRASFSLSGINYLLDKNDGKHCNHSGFHGFNRKWFTPEVGEDYLRLTMVSPDGEGGFPGNLFLAVIYRFTDENELMIDYQVETDRETPVNLTNHAYFNLSGKETILDHELKVFSEKYLEMRDDFTPTGNILPVHATPFDFREYTPVERLMKVKKERLKGYNSYFVSKKDNNGLHPLAWVKENDSGRLLTVLSTMPGVMFYTGDYLSAPFHPFQGLCLEAHYAPDGVNQQALGVNIVKPGQYYTARVVYQFSIISPIL